MLPKYESKWKLWKENLKNKDDIAMDKAALN